MLNKRASGVLLHISSLPSKYGIGCFDECAYAFVDFLKKAGQKTLSARQMPCGGTNDRAGRWGHKENALAACRVYLTSCRGCGMLIGTNRAARSRQSEERRYGTKGTAGPA